MANPKFEIYLDAAKKYRWRLKDSNSVIIASSGESFASKANATAAAQNVKKDAGKADIVDA